MAPRFHDQFVALFGACHHRLFRYLDRISGDPDLAADLAQDAFVRLYHRGALPDAPEAWLISVAMNLFRNATTTGVRRRRLLTISRAEAVVADPPPVPGQVSDAGAAAARVRETLHMLPERDRAILLLRAEGFSYRDIAAALDLNESSVGTLLARAKHAFRNAYEHDSHAP
jgi:RNA polymerase sigma-70 factor (ECF subfamily)